MYLESAHLNFVSVQAPQDEIVATTAYVNLFVSTITSPILMKVFLQYLCTGQHEGRLVLDSLLTRIRSNSRVNDRNCTHEYKCDCKKQVLKY